LFFLRWGVPKVTDEYRRARRDEIADAALRAFRRKGFQATSMAEIIEESGLSAGAIYGHYPSKAALVVDVASRVVRGRIDELEHLVDRTPMLPPQDVVRVLVTSMTRELGSPAVMLQLWGEAVTDPDIADLASTVLGRVAAAWTHYTSAWHQRTHGLSQEEAEAVAADQAPLLLAAVQGYVIQSSLVPGFDPEAYLSSVERNLLR
jgi:AcrR family transcriptional regulator